MNNYNKKINLNFLEFVLEKSITTSFGKKGIYYISDALKDPTKKASEKATFNEALIAAEFGKFNYSLFLLSIPCTWTNIFAPMSISYVVPQATCDLQLTLMDMGILNAVPYIGKKEYVFLKKAMSNIGI